MRTGKVKGLGQSGVVKGSDDACAQAEGLRLQEDVLARMADLDVIRILNEPTAAALAFGS